MNSAVYTAIKKNYFLYRYLKRNGLNLVFSYVNLASTAYWGKNFFDRRFSRTIVCAICLKPQ